MIKAPAAPSGWRFKGYDAYLVQDLVLRSEAVRYRRERWLTPAGRIAVAPLSAGITGHFGPELRRFVLLQHHQGQVTVERLAARLQAIGVSISKRQVMRLSIDRQDDFLIENREALRAGLQSAPWISVDDTGARHAGRNGFCTQIGNDDFAWFGTRSSKSRLNFLDLLRAGHTDYVINEAALAHMRGRGLASPLLGQLAAHPQTRFADHAAWQGHLDQLGVSTLHLTPVCIAAKGALWGSIHAHGFLSRTVIVSDDAGRFAVGRHALCWVHAERRVHKLDAFTELNRAAQQRMRALIGRFHADLKTHRADPAAGRRRERRARFDRIFRRRTGLTRRVRVAHVTLERLLGRLHANKPELLMALDRPEIPLHTNGSERDVRLQVEERKISGGAQSDLRRDCHDAFLGLMPTTMKLDVPFRDYLGDRLRIPTPTHVPYLPNLIRDRAQPV